MSQDANSNQDTNSNSLIAEISGAQFALLKAFHEKYDKEHSLTYTLEDCLVAGIMAKQRSKEYSESTQNRKKFEEALAADPSIIERPADMLKLMQKHHIGATKGKAA